MTNDTVERRVLRISRWYWKLLYVIAACLLVYLIAAIPLGAVLPGILRSVLAAALVLFGARIFRGPGEEVAPARAPWRMTAGIPSGIVGGCACALVAVGSIAGYVGLTAMPASARNDVGLPILLINAVLAAVLAGLFINSAVQLRRLRRFESSMGD
jgi:hypothetical protein